MSPLRLLTLSADAMHKFEVSNTTWGNVGAYHLDQLYDANRRAFESLLRRCSMMKHNTTSTLFMFLSPQFLVHHRNTLNIFVTCARERTLRLIAIDEVHIHVQHRTSFRADIRALRAEFFTQVCWQSTERSTAAVDCSISDVSNVLPSASV